MNVNYIHVVVIHMILMCLVHSSTGYSSGNNLLLQFRFLQKSGLELLHLKQVVLVCSYVFSLR